jgi:acetyl esterase/lipase
MTTTHDRTLVPLLLPGRLGDPATDFGSDPRSNARLVTAMAAFGMDKHATLPPVTATDSRTALLEWGAEAEAGFEQLYSAVTSGLPPITGVTRTVETITGVDGNTIRLYIHRPAESAGLMPGVIYLHSGGMVLLSMDNPLHLRWADQLAATGLIVVGVDFRNGAGKLGPHPFPAGLNDSFSALQWADARRDKLGVSKIVVVGDSGGGNLALATALKAKRDGLLTLLDGVYALAPHISGAYDWSVEDQSRELPSLLENDQYFTSLATSRALASLYDPDCANRRNPLAWPYHATEADLTGLPPHVISTNELDSVRDEGLVYARKLAHAGVSVISRTVNGIVHDADVIFEAALPELHHSAVCDIYNFASNL